MILPAQDIQRLTGFVRPTAQIRWLIHNGWKFLVNGVGAPVVALAEFNRQLVGGSVNKMHQEPNFDGLNHG